MNSFFMNGIFWRILFVDSHSPYLIDRTGGLKFGTTDPVTHKVYISDALNEDLTNKVLIHELGHCVIFSYKLLDVIHSFVYPEYWFEAEEWICNFIADYGFEVFSISHDILGKRAWVFIPKRMEKLIA